MTYSLEQLNPSAKTTDNLKYLLKVKNLPNQLKFYSTYSISVTISEAVQDR